MVVCWRDGGLDLVIGSIDFGDEGGEFRYGYQAGGINSI